MHKLNSELENDINHSKVVCCNGLNEILQFVTAIYNFAMTELHLSIWKKFEESVLVQIDSIASVSQFNCEVLLLITEIEQVMGFLQPFLCKIIEIFCIASTNLREALVLEQRNKQQIVTDLAIYQDSNHELFQRMQQENNNYLLITYRIAEKQFVKMFASISQFKQHLVVNSSDFIFSCTSHQKRQKQLASVSTSSSGNKQENSCTNNSKLADKILLFIK